MFAPQYPDGLRLDIYAYTLEAGNGGQDIKEINVLNHYIGMRDLAAEDFTEFQWMPFVIGALALLILRAVVHGTMATLVDVGGAVYATLAHSRSGRLATSCTAMAMSWRRRQRSRSTRSCRRCSAISRIANFEVYSYPQGASYAMAASMLLLGVAFVLAWRTTRRERHGALAP